MSSFFAHLLQSLVNPATGASNQQWTGGTAPQPGFGAPQPQYAPVYHSPAPAPIYPHLAAPPARANPYSPGPVYGGGQFLQPNMYPGAGYPPRPLSAPAGEPYLQTPGASPVYPVTRPSGGRFRDQVADALIRGIGSLAIGAQSSAYPAAGNPHVAETEPQYHSFRLTPLPPGGESFRLIEFDPLPTPSSPITCRLHTVNLHNHPSYTAVSYPVSVSKMSHSFRGLERLACGNGYIEVYGGMLNILHSVLNKYDPVYLWIDCFCISTRDPVEKAEQIALMKHIYRHAEETVIWLEEPSDNAQAVGQAFDALKIGHIHFNNIETRQAFLSKWTSTFAVVNTVALNQLLQKTYFSRTWMLQETALSSRAVIYCCKYRIRWADFCEQLSCLMKIGYVDMLMINHANSMTLHDLHMWIGRHRAFITLWQTLEQQRRLGRALTDPLPLKLKGLMRLTRGSNASDLRDRVYALLGLCSDGQAIRVDTRPQYTVEMLYHQLALYFTTAQSSNCDCDDTVCPNKELNFIGDAGIRNWNYPFFGNIEEKYRSRLENLPSWVPVWEYRPLRSMWTEAHSAGYRAGAGRRASVWYDPDSNLPRHLFVSGTLTSRIRYLTAPCPTFADKPEFLGLNNASKTVRAVRMIGGWHQEAFSLVQQCIARHHSRTEDFCRTLCANTSHIEDDLLPSEAPRVPIPNPRELVRYFEDFMELYKFAESHKFHWDLYTFVQSAALKNHGEGASKWSEITSFCVPHSTFFLTEDGLMGLGPSQAQVGDQVCVFSGAPMPALLRPVNPVTGDRYQIVGHAYVHGLMNGEAFELFPDREKWICME